MWGEGGGGRGSERCDVGVGEGWGGRGVMWGEGGGGRGWGWERE